jgi:hypothetical protein
MDLLIGDVVVSNDNASQRAYNNAEAVSPQVSVGHAANRFGQACN